MGGKGNYPPPPDPVDPGQSMGEYLFGQDFQSEYQGVTDRRLQERLIGAEREFRPQYAGLELQDIATFLRGIPAVEGEVNPQIARTQERIKDMEATLAKTPEKIEQVSSGVRGKRTTKEIDNPEYIKLKGMIEGSKADLKKFESTVSTPAQSGLFDLLEESGRRGGALQRDLLREQRADDIASLQELAPQVVQAYRDADPFSTAQAEMLSQQAQTLFDESTGQLSPERARMAEQSARQAAVARGRLGDSSALARELLGREEMRSALRAEARGALGQSFAMNRALAGDLGSTILGRPSAGLQTGQSVLSQAQQQAAQQMGPQLFDANKGIELGLQQRSQDMSLLGAQAQAKAQDRAATTGLVGSLASSFITPFT